VSFCSTRDALVWRMCKRCIQTAEYHRRVHCNTKRRELLTVRAGVVLRNQYSLRQEEAWLSHVKTCLREYAAQGR
jgi:hypothetical protein